LGRPESQLSASRIAATEEGVPAPFGGLVSLDLMGFSLQSIWAASASLRPANPNRADLLKSAAAGATASSQMSIQQGKTSWSSWSSPPRLACACAFTSTAT
jgi:hypothetical protein